jgi:FAD-dependent urate hydroxylase
LPDLTERAREDLERIAHPDLPWLTPRLGPDGQPALDVLIVGAGQSGITIAGSLMRAQVANILVVDRAPRGAEGPWRTYARMHTLRSPKTYTGPDLDLPSLGYQAWHEARYGADDWRALDLIRREDWAAYLDWVRETIRAPVRNDTALIDIDDAGNNLLAATLRDDDGEHVRYARRVVLATGQEGAGLWWMPPAVAALPPHLRAHTADPIDFGALRGKHVAVLGAGASALDNAATALEAGARVTLFCRRPVPQLVQPYRWLTFAGFLRHLSDLDDPWRWRFMARILAMREGFPQATWDRCACHPAFRFRPGADWTDIHATADSVSIATPDGDCAADFVICGTGIAVDFAQRPELRRIAANIARWSDRYEPPPEERDDRLAAFPYLGPDYTLLPRVPGETVWMRAIHLFNIATTMSFGPSGASINALTTAVPKLTAGITRALFAEDVERHWTSLCAYDLPQAVLRAVATSPPDNHPLI